MPASDPNTHDTLPWHRQFWPWVLIMLPAAAVIASFITLFIAMDEPDGLVADDYYKEGLAINRALEADRRALDLGIHAELMLNPAGDAVQLVLAKSDAQYPSQLTLRLAHPTRANLDQSITLPHQGAGIYRGPLTPGAPGNWHVFVEDAPTGWRIAGRMPFPQTLPIRLEPRVAAGR